MKVMVDRTRCTGLGICESLAADYFEVNEDGDLEQLREEISPEDLSDVEEAVAGCPTAALSINRATS